MDSGIHQEPVPVMLLVPLALQTHLSKLNSLSQHGSPAHLQLLPPRFSWSYLGATIHTRSPSDPASPFPHLPWSSLCCQVSQSSVLPPQIHPFLGFLNKLLKSRSEYRPCASFDGSTAPRPRPRWLPAASGPVVIWPHFLFPASFPHYPAKLNLR